MTDAETIAELRRIITDQHRQIEELRAAVDALLQPAPSELLEKNRAHASRQLKEDFTHLAKIRTSVP